MQCIFHDGWAGEADYDRQVAASAPNQCRCVRKHNKVRALLCRTRSMQGRAIQREYPSEQAMS